jgi:hypothetical protein
MFFQIKRTKKIKATTLSKKSLAIVLKYLLT